MWGCLHGTNSNSSQRLLMQPFILAPHSVLVLKRALQGAMLRITMTYVALKLLLNLHFLLICG